MSNTLDLDTATKNLFRVLGSTAKKHHICLYAVGGFIRDRLLGHPTKDIDFVVLGDALQFAKYFEKKHAIHSLVSFPKFGTCKFQYRGYHLEFVSARQEAYQYSSRKPSVQEADLFTDLSRRDFTINSIAMKIEDDKQGILIDPYNGVEDLQAKKIITPLAPDKTFSDDPLRMMRAIRFASSLSFQIEPNTFRAIKNCAPRLTIVSQERITAEFNKILLSPVPSIGLKLLDASELLPIFLPEFVETKGVEQKYEYHHKDVFYHTLQVLDQLAPTSDKLELRLAALLHDIAKPRTKRFDRKSGWTFHGHDALGARMSVAILRRLKYPNHTIQYIRRLVWLHLRPMALVNDTVTDSAIRRLLFTAAEHFDDLMKLCRADITSKNPKRIKKHLQNYNQLIEKAALVEEKDRLRAFKSPVDGNELIEKFKLAPGPKIGEIKKFIEEAILEGLIPNEHDAALDYILAHKKDLKL